jgi:outer membrane protein assembly factor BamB
LIWHRDVPTETRAIDHRVLSKLGYRGGNFSPELRAKFEDARINRNPRLRGDAFEEWAKQWVEENFDKEQQLSLGSWAIQRLREGVQAISLDDFDTLAKVRTRRFENFDAMVAWIDEQGFAQDVKERIIKAVPDTRLAAEDVIACLDAATGETLWKAAFASEETSRSASSTPCVANGRVFAALRDSVYCVDAGSGELLWKSPLPSAGPASCPLLVEGKIVILADRLVAYGLESGEKVWEQEALKGKNASPVAWETGGRTLIACNSRDEVVVVEARDGAVVWRGKGGGDATPVVSGDHLVVLSSAKQGGLMAYKLNAAVDGLEETWSHTWVSRRKSATPIIHDGYVYLMGGEKHLCIDLESGEIKWEMDRKSDISSPLLETNGSYLSMIKAAPEAYEELGRAKLGGLKCPSPAIADGKLFLRMPNGIACFDLRESS